MAKNTLQDLRDHLFATLEALTDGEKPMEIERAQAVCKVSTQIIETAKVEVKFMAVTGAQKDIRFFEDKKPGLPNGKVV